MPFPFTCPHCGAGYRIKDELAGKRATCKKCEQTMTLAPPEPEVTEGGSVVHRLQERAGELEIATGDAELIEAVGGHIAQYIGEPDSVFHEIISDLVHIDVHVVKPTPQRPWLTLVTSGMSERPMTTPEELEGMDYAELMMCLPPDWPIGEEFANFSDEENYWPIRGLKFLARLPHEYETWLGPGHTVPNGDPPAPFHDGTKLCCLLVVPPVGAKEGVEVLTLPDGRRVNFYSVLPLYKEEMKLKLRRGADALGAKLAELPLEQLFDPGRKNVAAKRFGLF